MQMKPPIVLHVIPGLGTGGAEHMLANLVAAPRAQPISQVVVNLMNGGELSATIRSTGIPVHDLGANSTMDAPIAVVRLAKLIAEYKPVAVQSWLYYADLASLWALKLSGRRAMTRLYWGVRSSDMEQRQYRWALAWTINTCVRQSGQPDAVVANSFVGRDVHRRLGYAPKAFPVIPNGVDTVRFRPDAPSRDRIRQRLGIPADMPVAIHVARVDPMKDHASFVAIAAAIPNVQFIMVGAGTENIAAPPNTLALGMRRDVPELLAASDFAISTSAFGEGFSNVIAQAMACGLPVAATDIGDARRIIGDGGTIVPARNVPAMVAAIRDILEQPPAEKQRRAAYARQRMTDLYSLESAVAAYDALHLHGEFEI